MQELFDKLPTLLAWGLLFGLIFGFFVARKSAAEKPIRGMLANAFHFIGAALFSAVAPTVFIAAIVFHLGFIRDVIVGLCLLGLAFVSLLISAATEEPQKNTAQ